MNFSSWIDSWNGTLTSWNNMPYTTKVTNVALITDGSGPQGGYTMGGPTIKFALLIMLIMLTILFTFGIITLIWKKIKKKGE